MCARSKKAAVHARSAAATRSAAAARPGATPPKRGGGGSPAAPLGPWWRDGWLWGVGLSALPLVLHSVGASLGEPVAEDFDFLHRALLSGSHSLLDGGGSQAFWRPVSHQLYYLALGRLMLSHPRMVAGLHAALMMIAAVLVYRALRLRWSGAAAAVAASFPLLAESTRTLLSWPSQFVDLGLWLFTAVALYETSRRRLWGALVGLALALGCKELAVVGAVLLPWLPGLGPRGLRERLRWAGAMGAVVLVWGAAYLWVRHAAHLELPHHLEHTVGAALTVRYQWAWWNSARAMMSLPLTSVPQEGWVGLALLALMAVVAALTLGRRAWRGAAERWRWVVWGMTWFALSSAALVVIYPLWQPNRSAYGSMGAGVAAAALIEGAHPLLLVALVAVRLFAFAEAPGPPKVVTSRAPETGAFMDFGHLVRLQRLMEAVRLKLKNEFPHLSHNAVVCQHDIPLLAEYAFGRSLALQAWYRDTTLRWSRFDEFQRDSTIHPATIVEYQPEGEAVVALVDPRIMRLADAASDRVLHDDWSGALALIERTDSLRLDPDARVMRSMIETRRAIALSSLGRNADSERAARLALSSWPGNPNARYWIAYALFQERRTREADAVLDTMLTIAPADSFALVLRDDVRAAIAKAR